VYQKKYRCKPQTRFPTWLLLLITGLFFQNLASLPGRGTAELNGVKGISFKSNTDGSLWVNLIAHLCSAGCSRGRPLR